MIRPAETRDAELVAALAGQLGYPSDAESMRARLAALGESRQVFVAERDGVVRAWIEVAVVEALVSDAYAEIHGLIVDETERGSGLGAQLVAAAEEWAAERRLARIRVRSNVARERTRRFYEKQGYVVTKTSNVFDKVL